ncbi:MAG TPA: alkaline phosphatase family protein [Steroidobacteraceae bacterium]|nr:alkaline phosphatase family protein [Steroidobacteraceae bacterium]
MPGIGVRKLTILAFAAAVSFAGLNAQGQGGGQDDAGHVATAAAGIRHVFVILLENKNYEDTFGNSTQDPYLQKQLVSQGALLTRYFGTGHVSLDNYIALISGQSPTPDTADDCPNFTNVEQTGTTGDGQVIAAKGCVYGSGVRNIVDQLKARGLSWKGYMEDMGNDPARESATCGHPAVGGRDNARSFQGPSEAVPQGDGYVTRHNPFVYFHSIIDSPDCNAHVVRLEALPADLTSAATTPGFALIAPNLCNDGHDGSGDGRSRCKNGEPGGLASIDAFLQAWVPKITSSPAFQKDGLLVITFDESNSTMEKTTDPQTGATITNFVFPGKACCGQQPGPNLAGVRPGTTALGGKSSFVYEGFGGDRVGALLLSPFIKPGSTSDTAYNHYSLLRSIEDILGLDGHLGYAANDRSRGYVLDTIGNDRAIFREADKPRAK